MMDNYQMGLLAMAKIKAGLTILNNISINDDYCLLEEQIDECFNSLRMIQGMIRNKKEFSDPDYCNIHKL